MPSTINKPLHAARAWAANRTVFVELDDGRVFGLPARQHEGLASLTDDELGSVTIWRHDRGDVLKWQWGAEGQRFSISVWDFVEGTPRAVRAWVEGRTVLFEVADGRVFGFPAAGFERLAKASDAELATVEVQASGYGLRWEPVDEDISVPGMVARSRWA